MALLFLRYVFYRGREEESGGESFLTTRMDAVRDWMGE